MLRSLYSGVSGLKGFQTYLDVTGNNVANVNTLGYKKSSANFEDLLYQTHYGGSKANGKIGGINPKQIGLGTKIGAIETINTQGALEPTGVNSNMAIEGKGYFMLRHGGQTYYTRAGNFVKDGYGNLVKAGDGYELQGYMFQSDPTAPGEVRRSDVLSTVNIPMGHKRSAEATNVISYRCNLDAGVNPYLPFGVPDYPMTLSYPNGETPPEKVDYTARFVQGEGAADFLSLQFTDPSGVESVVTLELTGVDAATGKPQLNLTSGPAVSLGGVDYPVTYDAATGELTVGSGTNSQTFGLLEMTDFQGFSAPDTLAGTDYDVLAEFDDDGATLTLWVSDGGGGLTRHRIPVSYDGEGAFEVVDLGASDPPLPGSLATNLILTKTSSDRALTFEWLDPGAVGGSYEPLATITQEMESIYSTPYDIYDSLGNKYPLTMTFKKVGANTWSWSVALKDHPNIPVKGGSGVLHFSSDGKLLESDVPEIEIDYTSVGGKQEVISLDFAGEKLGEKLGGVTQYGSPYTTKALYQDGHSMGVLEDFYVQNDGVVMGMYTNEEQVPFYQIPLAMFPNPGGLLKARDTVFQAAADTGNVQLVNPLEEGAGKITGGAVEYSNVDIVDEFANMIKGQRGYQANARIVTTSDQILEETINLRR